MTTAGIAETEKKIKLKFLNTAEDGKHVKKKYSENILQECSKNIAAMLEFVTRKSGSIPIPCSSECFDDAYPFLQALHDSKTKNECEKKWVELQDKVLENNQSRGLLI